MERKIGDTFEFEGKKLQVKESSSNGCDGCFFDEQHIPCSKNVAGYCEFEFRADKKEVIFVEATEQEQTEQPQKLNLCEILKDCPKGTKLYSTVLGYVIFQGIVEGAVYPIVVICENGVNEDFTADGKMFIDFDGECTLFPSKEQRSWADFIVPWLKKERFDPKTLKPFDKVLVRVFGHHIWKVDFYSHKGQGKEFPYICVGNTYKYCIPYNDDTKHLIGTTDEAPEYYRY